MNSSSFRILDLLEKRDMRKFYLIGFFQIINNILDILALAILATVISEIRTNLSSNDEVIKIDIFLAKFQVQPSRFLEFAIFGLILVGILFIAKSTFSVVLNKKALNNISIIAKNKMNVVTNQYLGQPISVINKRDLHLDANTLTFGSDYLIEGIQSRIQIWSEGLLFISMLIFLGIVDIYLWLFFTVFFTLMLVLLSKFVSSKQEVASKMKLENTIDTYRNVIASVTGYKEVKVSGNMAKVITKLGQNRTMNSVYSSKFLFLVNLPRQLIEISLYLVLILILFLLLATSSNALDPAKLVLFLVAGVRLVPSSIRLNSGIAALRNSKVGLMNLRKMNLEVAFSTLKYNNSDKFHSYNDMLANNIEIRDLEFRYAERDHMIFNKLNLEIGTSEILLIQGESGTGKSTLLDLIAGLEIPLRGSISIGGNDATVISGRYPRQMAYVTQGSFVFPGTILDNLVFLDSEREIDFDLLWSLLNSLNLAKDIEKLGDGILTVLGENGKGLSGGQLQRLSLARALYIKPKVLLLDEPTSFLDYKNEGYVVETLANLKQGCTMVISAHNSTFLNSADKVLKIP